MLYIWNIFFQKKLILSVQNCCKYIKMQYFMFTLDVSNHMRFYERSLTADSCD